jgi:hypothetical protein
VSHQNVATTRIKNNEISDVKKRRRKKERDSKRPRDATVPLSPVELTLPAMTARYWMIFFVFSVLPAPDSPLHVRFRADGKAGRKRTDENEKTEKWKMKKRKNGK